MDIPLHHKKFRTRKVRVIGKCDNATKNIYGCTIPPSIFLALSGLDLTIKFQDNKRIILEPIK